MLSVLYVLLLVIISFGVFFATCLVIKAALRLWTCTRSRRHPRDEEIPELYDERTSLIPPASPTITLASETDPRRGSSSASSTSSSYHTFTRSQEQTIVDALCSVQGIPLPISPLPPSPKCEEDNASSKWSFCDSANSDTEVEFYSHPGSYKELSTSSVERSMCSTMEMSLKSALDS
ncbi:uncharacterized protein LOC119579537 [Penaeus monodon]|uniref:uncharacterized protein LOC119579537 n=1 Tax=Penaeus monodon TaxID=6687 RepID=UPI0018A6DEE1|nr:uncharacterized protein LOC119579537 [Penaeus monodon]